ncbi:MAG: IS630 family transposase [Halorhabdus sp.]
MDHLEEIPIEELHDALDSVEEKRPTQRLLAAIAYKNGITQTELAEWFGTGRRTIYSWLQRFDTDEPLTEAVSDDHRSGRNRKLSENQLKEFRETLHESPREVGYDEPAWTTKLVRHHLETAYDVEYSIPSCRRLLKEAGLSYQKPRPENAKAEPEDREEFDETPKKKRRDLDATVVCIDQTKTSVNGDPTQAWFQRNSRPRVELSGLRDWTCLLDAVTADGRSIFSRFPEYVTADHAKHFILALYKEFEDDLIVLLDGASYFRASKVRAVADRDGIEFVQLPAYRPDLNPVEECWRYLDSALGNKYFESIDELTATIDAALDQLSLPEVSNYF